MKTKLAIAVCIVLAGTALFLPQAADLFPAAPEIADAAADLSAAQKDAAGRAEAGMSSLIDLVNDQADGLGESSEGLLAAWGPGDIIPTQLREAFSGNTDQKDP